MAMTCVHCNVEFTGPGNNPWPIYRTGRCCNKCDDLYVTPARLGEWDWQAGRPTPRGKMLGEALHEGSERLKKLVRQHTRRPQ